MNIVQSPEVLEVLENAEFLFPRRKVDRFREILNELGDLHDKKSGDYGAGEDPYANVRASQEFGVPPWVGAMIRLNDKITRVKSFIRNGNLKNESLEDSLRDIGVYAIIALLLWEEQRDQR